MTHDAVRERLPDLLFDRDDPELLEHICRCHDCQRHVFLLGRVDRLLRQRAAEIRTARSRVRLALAAAASVAVAAAALLALVTLPGHSAAPTSVVLKTAGGAVVARAEIRSEDPENQSIALVAHGLPAVPTDIYLLWTSSAATGRSLVVGRFMVNHSGTCRAHFNLAGARHSARFWITPSSRPAAVVATT